MGKTEKDAKDERLAAALRENLKRRKAQAREAGEDRSLAQAGAQTGEAKKR
jgi:hypothetical protein